ncbi:MAG: hypothetical protein K2O18_09530 [Oscillospiraceae bacterium]|nr:hypothetical protein [Oscillospiraceae bacterium]
MQFIIKGELELKLGENEAGNIRLSAVLADKTTASLAGQGEPVHRLESSCGSTTEASEPRREGLAEVSCQGSDWEA